MMPDDTRHDGAAPLTAGELAEIKARHFESHPLRGPDNSIRLDYRFVGVYIADHERLIAEVESQRATIAAYREIVAAVARMEASTVSGTLVKTYPDMEAFRARARALLATSTTDATDANEQPCELCGGTGIYVQEVAWENPDGTGGTDIKRITCHGCNGTGRQKQPQEGA